MLGNALLLSKIGCIIPGTPLVGVLGFPDAQPSHDFAHSTGNIISMRALATQDGECFEVRIKARAVNPGTLQMQCAVYDATADDAGDNAVISLDEIDFDENESELVFNVAKTYLNGNQYTFAFQANGDWYFNYGPGDGLSHYGFIGNIGYANFPANYSGITLFDVIVQAWSKFTY